MIPKVIHYCWFGDDKPERLMRRCMDSWKRVMPDFAIKCWDKHSFDFDSVPFTKEAMAAKKYAFAADYIRLYALYHEGGIYLDADVMVYKTFQPLLSNDFFSGTEAYYAEGEAHYRIEAAIMGAIPQHPFVKDCLDYYSHQHFIKAEGGLNLDIIPDITSRICVTNYAYQYKNATQHLPGNTTIYPTSYFTNALIPDANNPYQLFAKHCNAASWMDFKKRGAFFHFCRKHDMMALYHWIEKLKG